MYYKLTYTRTHVNFKQMLLSIGIPATSNSNVKSLDLCLDLCLCSIIRFKFVSLMVYIYVALHCELQRSRHVLSTTSLTTSRVRSATSNQTFMIRRLFVVSTADTRSAATKPTRQVKRDAFCF